jgi:hypothetical protein
MRIFAIDSIINFIFIVSIRGISKNRLIPEVCQGCCPLNRFTYPVLLALEKGVSHQGKSTKIILSQLSQSSRYPPLPEILNLIRQRCPLPFFGFF